MGDIGDQYIFEKASLVLQCPPPQCLLHVQWSRMMVYEDIEGIRRIFRIQNGTEVTRGFMLIMEISRKVSICCQVADVYSNSYDATGM
jgi:hypothetical protein